MRTHLIHRRPPTAISLLVLPLVLTAQHVNVSWKGGAEFGNYQTYSWIEGAHAPQERTHQRIVSAVENELATKGWWLDDQEPDVYLSYYTSTKDEVTIDSPYRTSWYDDATIRVRRIHEGTLMLDMVDEAANELVWRGIVTEALSDNPRRNDSRINDTIRKLLDGFPPGRQ